MKLQHLCAIALLAACTLSTAQAADKGGINIPMIHIPGRDYEMGKTEVTQDQWVAVMGENPSSFSKCGGDCPVESVSWEDAIRFIKRLNKKTGKDYRLPTEAEWEYACHAGSNDTYCGGNDLDKLGWYMDNSGDETSPVASKKPNAWGFYDMSGNVWEWCQDKYDNEHDWRVPRGGSWVLGATTVRADYRYNRAPAERLSFIGFRLARTLP